MLKNFLCISKRNPGIYKNILIFFCVLSLASICFSAIPSPVSVGVAVDKSEIRVGEEISLKINVITENDPGKIHLTGYEKLLTDFDLVDSTHTSHEISRHKYENTSVYRLKSLRTGAYETAVLNVYLEDTLIATSAMIYLDVYKKREEFGLSGEKIRMLEKYPRYLMPAFVFSSALLALLCAFRIYGMMKTKGKIFAEKTNSYKVEANDILKEYSDMKRKYSRVASSEEIREFYYDMSRMLRDYVDRIYGIDLMESTPKEAENIFMISNEFTPSIEKRIVLFMEKCDSIKYSKKEVGKAELRADFDKFQRLFKRVLKDMDSDIEGSAT